MKFYSTKNKNNQVNFKDAVIKGIADDGGLFLPLEIPILDKSFLESLSGQTFQEIALTVATQFIEDIPKNELQTIIESSLYFKSLHISANRGKLLFLNLAYLSGRIEQSDADAIHP